jgi:LmbE family N-acetylglucosaminyl deacetylase
LVVILIGIGFIFLRPKKEDDTVIIVLSPHYDDAVLSLGGMLAKREHPAVVATFFTAEPEIATSTSWDKNSGFSDSHQAIESRVKENAEALKVFGATVKDYGYSDVQYRGGTSTDAVLEQEMTQDIQALLAAYGDKNILVYAPAIFTPTITHPDHAVVHRAFLTVADSYPKDNVTFYFYEDYPYIAEFNRESVFSLSKNLENETQKIFTEERIIISSRQLRTKEKSLSKYGSQIKAFDAIDQDIIKNDIEYTKNRCGAESACEVVYKLFRITE